MSTNLLCKYIWVLGLCVLSTFKSNANNNQTQALPTQFTKFSYVQGNGFEDYEIYAFGGERLKYRVNLRSNQPQTFEGQWGIAIGNYIDTEDNVRKLEIEYVIYESDEFELAAGDSITKEVLTKQLGNIDSPGSKYIFPIIKSKSTEWLIDETNCKFVELYPQPAGILAGHLQSPDHQDRGTLFDVVAPIVYKDDIAQKNKDYQIVMYRLNRAISRFSFEYEKVYTISESKDGDTYTCRIPTFIAPGKYTLAITERNAPNFLMNSSDRSEFEVYGPLSGANNYTFFKDIEILEKEHFHNIKMTEDIDILAYAPDYIEAQASLTNCDNRYFSGWIELALTNQNGEQIILPANYFGNRDYFVPNERRQKWLKYDNESPLMLKNNKFELPDGSYTMYFVASMGGSKPQKIVGINSNIIDEVTIDIKSTTSIENTSESSPAIKLYPNPVTDILNIEVGDDVVQSVKLFDTHGRLVLIEELSVDNIDMSGLPHGSYILKLKTSRTNSTHKINKK